MKKLHPLQEKILRILKKQQEFPLSIRELQDILGVSSPSLIHHHILQLEKKGYIRRDPYNPRNYQILEWNESESILYLNLYGLAQCGPQGRFLEGNPVEKIPMPRKMINFDITKAYLVKANGDSMKPKINEGDLILAEASCMADNQQIVVCTYQWKALIKRFQRDENYIILSSINSENYPPIFAKPEDVRIEWLVRGIVSLNI